MTDAYKEAFPNGATDAQLQEWIDKNLAPFPGHDKDKIKEWLEKTGGAKNRTY